MNDRTLNLWAVSSQSRIFADSAPTDGIKRLGALRNEPVSFFVAYRAIGKKAENGRDTDLSISIQVTSETLPLSVYKILSVPFPAAECEDAEPSSIGGCPDILLPRSPSPEIIHNAEDTHLPFYEAGEDVLLCASSARTQALCVTVNENGASLSAGEHTVTVRAISLRTGESLGELSLTVGIVDALLPENDALYTNWIHYDCLADTSGLPLWSDGYFELLGKYIEGAVRYGMNTLLTPAFTPALDTCVGGERKNVQLVGVTRVGGKYVFDFSLLRRFILLALEKGIKYFEHCHLFTQWGARTAINIYGADGERIFGWETPALDGEYVRFLNEYLEAFLSLADGMGIGERLLFHISDEPAKEHSESYANALGSVRGVLRSRLIGDALSDYSYYEKGLTEFPIVDTPYADDFDGRCDNFMLYYTGGEKPPHLSNRLLTSSPQKTRILGVQLYRYRARGFLHWGYNYTYGRMSRGIFNPATDPCFYKNIPAVTYLIYGNADKEPLHSLRELQMRDAMNDLRALRLCESYVGRDAVLGICEEVLGEKIGITTLPADGGTLLILRERINMEIRKALK
ncbi:MAG: DUF4091 domain-containing protein [Clostridia bacterium]|nr:DUF4091 domain-containing protein [Clostridia bacterium]